jgi:Thiol:disulfide interchange protein DsbD, N-terminal
MQTPIAVAAALGLSVAAAAWPPPEQTSPAIPPAQQASSAPARDRIETNHLVAIASVSQPVVAPGTRLSLFLEVTPKPKMHVYAPEQKTYIPISVKLDGGDSFKAHPPVFPKPETFLFVPLNENQLVYSKPFRIVQDVTVASTAAMRARARAADATLTIKATMRYQACDDEVCYVPKEVAVSWTTKLQGLGK